MRPAPTPLERAIVAAILGLLVVASVACVCGSARAAKSDIAILKNGDRITGEVKGVARGKLDFSTDDAGRMSIEWTKVARLTSPLAFEVELWSGESFTGRFVSSPDSGLLVIEGIRSDTVWVNDVVQVDRLRAAIWKRITSYLDLGLSLAKANQATTFSLSGEADYRGPTMGTEFSLDSYAQGQEGDRTTKRNTARQTLSWFLPDRWSAVGLGQYEQNDELGLHRRFTVGAAMNRVVKHTNSKQLGIALGLVGIDEQFNEEARTATDGASETSMEGLLSVNWDAYRFDFPKLDLSTSLDIYPGLSEFGRVRGQYDLRLKYEVFRDFNLGILFTDTFDTRPPQEGANKNDYITTFTVGWSYRR